MGEKVISGTEATIAPSVETSETLISSGSTPPRGAEELAPADPQRYTMADEVGRGGLGRILRATDNNLGRSVAIKELLHQDDDLLARFAREALVTARLMHPAIVPVYDAGRWPNGMPFYAMKMVTGRSLDQVIQAAPTLQDRLALLTNVIAVAEAIAYAHSEGIIHRDLKPANVLVGSFGETVVIDWGLAKDLRAPEESLRPGPYRGDSSSGTVVGSVLGTPSYMPPEQALGDPVDETADVYALGALLYHLLAGGAPYAARSAEAVLALVITGPPKPLPEGVPPELLAIVDKAMAREKAARYPTAGELAADLKRFTTGQLVSAHLYTPGALIKRWIAKRRGVVSIGAIALAALVGVGVYAYVRVGGERDVAVRRADESAIAQARALLGSDPSRALAALANLSPAAPSDLIHRLALEAVTRGIAIRELVVGDGAQAVGFLQTGEVVVGSRAGIYRWSERGAQLIAPAPAAMRDELPVVMSPDGATLAVRIFPGNANDRHGDGAQLIDVATGRSGAFLPMPLLGQVLFMPDSKRLILAGAKLAIVEVATGERHEADLPNAKLDRGTNLALTGTTLLVAGTEDIARCDLSAMTCALIPDAEPDSSPRSQPVPIVADPEHATYGGLHTISKIALADLSVERNAGSVDSSVYAIAQSPDARWGAVMTRTYSVNSGKLYFYERDGHASKPWTPGVDFTALAVTDDRAVVGTTAFAGVALSDDGKRLELRGQADEIRSVAVHGDELASASADGSVRLWRVSRSAAPCGLPGLSRIAFSADRTVAVVHDRTGLVVCDVPANRSRTVVTSQPITDWGTGAVSPDGKRVAVVGRDQVVVVELATGATRQLRAHPAATARWTSAGLLLTSLAGTEIFTADLASSREVFPYNRAAMHATFAPDLAHAVVAEMVGGEFRPSQLLELATLKRSPLPEGRDYAFSPDGTQLAVPTGAQLTLIELATGKSRMLAGGDQAVYSLLWSPDGRRVISLGDDGLRSWDVATGATRILFRATGHRGVRDAAFSPDGARLIAITGLAEAYLIDLDAGTAMPLGAADAGAHALFWPDNRHFAAAGMDRSAVWDDPVPTDPAELRAWIARTQMTTTVVR